MTTVPSGIGEAISAYSKRQVESAYRKVTFKILPLIIIAYIVAYIDRVNVGFAKLQFLHDLQFSEAIYGLGAGLFFIGYMLFEVPSNLLLERVGARVTLTRIMIIWGLISIGMAFISTPTQFYVMRFLLGAAEAGFFPGVILYLSYWFPAPRRARIVALFAMGGALAGIIGSPLSGWLLSLDGTHGLHGWQILFIYEGLPAVLLGVFTYCYLDEKPEQVKWLDRSEKAIVVGALSAESQGTATGARSHGKFRHVLRDPKVYAAAIAYIAVIAGTSTLGLWAPTLFKRMGTDASMIGILTGAPYIIAVISMYLVGRNSDRTQERRWHYACSMFAAGVSVIMLGLGAENIWITMALLTVASCGVWSSLAVFWTIPLAYLNGSAKAGGIALISSIGALGGFISPTIVGWVTTRTGSLYLGLAAIGMLLILSAVILLLSVGPNPQGNSHAVSGR